MGELLELNWNYKKADIDVMEKFLKALLEDYDNDYIYYCITDVCQCVQVANLGLRSFKEALRECRHEAIVRCTAMELSLIDENTRKYMPLYVYNTDINKGGLYYKILKLARTWNEAT